jgi:hypothetical protein
MNQKESDQNRRSPRRLMSTFVSLTISVFAVAYTSAAQTASNSAPQTANTSSSSSTTVNTPKVKFSTDDAYLNLRSGTTSAFNLCTGVDVTNTLQPGFTDADGLKMDTADGQCGETTPSSTVSGGNPPYNFQLDSGSFPPLGMHLGLNGLLYGTPAPPTLGGYKPFRVCAVDVGGNPDCQEVKVGPKPTAQAKTGGAHTGLILGGILLGGAAVAGIAGAEAMSKASTASASSSSSDSGSDVVTGQCTGLSGSNACGTCTCNLDASGASGCTDSSECPGGSCWTGGTAPFCN